MNLSRLSIFNILLATLLIIVVLNVENTAMYIAIKPIMQALTMPVKDTSLIVTVYLLVFAAFIILGGQLGDNYGRRNVLIMGLLLCTVGALLCGIAKHTPSLLFGRLLQGFGAALAWPNTTAIVLNIMPANKKGFAAGLIGALAGAGLAVGPIISGIFCTYLSWRWVFLFNIPLCLLAIVIFACHIENEKATQKIKIDGLNSLLLIVALSSLAYGFVQFSWLFCAIALILMVIFFNWQKRSVYPLLPNELMHNKSFIMGCLLRLITVIPFYITMFLMSLYLEKNLQANTFYTGLCFIGMTLTIGILSPFGGKLIDRIGEVASIFIGALFYLIGFIALALFVLKPSLLLIFVLLILPGIGFSFTSPGTLAMSMRAAPTRFHASATGIYYMVSITSGMMAVAISSIILNYTDKPSIISTSNFEGIMLLTALLSVIALFILRFSNSKS